MFKKCEQYIAHGKECPLVYVYILYPVFGISVLFVNAFEKFFRNGHNEIKFGSQWKHVCH